MTEKLTNNVESNSSSIVNFSENDFKKILKSQTKSIGLLKTIVKNNQYINSSCLHQLIYSSFYKKEKNDPWVFEESVKKFLNVLIKSLLDYKDDDNSVVIWIADKIYPIVLDKTEDLLEDFIFNLLKNQIQIPMIYYPKILELLNAKTKYVYEEDDNY